jgi:hypothetical protein
VNTGADIFHSYAIRLPLRIDWHTPAIVFHKNVERIIMPNELDGKLRSLGVANDIPDQLLDYPV